MIGRREGEKKLTTRNKKALLVCILHYQLLNTNLKLPIPISFTLQSVMNLMRNKAKEKG